MGGISYFDTELPVGNIEKRFDVYPFKIKYKIIKDGRIIECDTENGFHLDKIISDEKGFSSVYISKNGNLEVTVTYQFIENCSVIRTFMKIVNLKKDTALIEFLTSANVSGISGQKESYDYVFKDISVHVLENIWSAEGKLTKYSLDDLYLSKVYKHASREKFSIGGSGSHTTRKYFPLMFIHNARQNKIWFFQYEPVSAWKIQLVLKDCEGMEGAFLNVQTFTSDAVTDNWQVLLAEGESYATPVTVFGAVNGYIDEAVKELTIYRRNYLKRSKKITPPLVFNDYMNCHWSKQTLEKTTKLCEAAQRLGAEVFCLDAGWYNDNALGDWLPSEEVFLPENLQYIIDKVHSLGMKCGLWLEIECCTKNSKAASLPDSWFLTRNGIRIYEVERYYFDFSNPEVTAYLRGCVERLYRMGIRYIKNDYNVNLGFGCDYNGVCSSYGLERQFYYIKKFFDSLTQKFDDLIIENCGSGGMREDYFMLSSFDIQSITDCENYINYPPIINGTMLNILPEQCGIWCMPYPHYFHEMDNESFDTEIYRKGMADGEHTIFNVVNGMMGVMYLSGRMDKADDFNFNLLKEGVDTYKRYRDFINSSYAVFPYRLDSISQRGFAVQGLKNGNRMLLGVFRRGGNESRINIEIKDIANAKIVYPVKGFEESVSYTVCDNGLTIDFTADFQARLFEIELK